MMRPEDDPAALPPVIPGPIPFQKTRALNSNALGQPLVFEHMPGAPVNTGRGAVDRLLPPPIAPPSMAGITPHSPIDPARSATANLPRVPMEDELMRGILSGGAMGGAAIGGVTGPGAPPPTDPTLDEETLDGF